MPFLKSLPDDAVLLQVFKAFPEAILPLLEYHEILMRGSSPLSVVQRELIAAYVSGLNACTYCHGVHTGVAEVFGVPQGLLADLLSDFDNADLEEPLRPILAYVRKLTEKPASLTFADAEAVYAAGWDEKALHDAVGVCALFNFMNRYVEGLGITAGPDYFKLSAQRLHDGGYMGLAKLLQRE